MYENFWKDKYPQGIPSEIDADQFQNIQQVFKYACERYTDKYAFTNIGHSISYSELYRLSGNFAAWLQKHTDLVPGERIALQMPNLLQYTIALFGAIRAGLIIVNTNPLYTAREMEHQFNDSGAKALVCLANMAHLAEQVIPKTSIRHVVITEIGDMLPFFKRHMVNAAVRYVKKMIPPYNLPQALSFRKVLELGEGQTVVEANPMPGDLAILQYTGGTTGVAKGAMLSHRNMIANMMQGKALAGSELVEGEEIIIAPLPLYHIYAFTAHCMMALLAGAHNVLITDPRNAPLMTKAMSQWKFTAFLGLNTLFVSLCNYEPFRKLDFSKLRLTASGGMPLQQAIADRWKQVTGCPVHEGYGLTETSPIAAANPYMKYQIGTIGMPVPSTLFKTIDAQGNDLPIGEVGELCIKGPQVMQGYWQRPDATAEVLDKDGWLKTGDVGFIQPDGYIRIVDRKKDMILVSGFNVYPNELEDVLANMSGVYQCAAIGVPDEKSGETIKVFVVRQPGSTITEEQVLKYMHDNLTGYKRPKYVEFRNELPLTPVGKVLRRELRDEEMKKRKA